MLMLQLPALIKEIGRGAKGARDLLMADAEQLFAAMLNGDVPDLELGAILLSLRIKGESDEELREEILTAETEEDAEDLGDEDEGAFEDDLREKE